MLDIAVEDLLRRRVACLGAVGHEPRVDLCRVAAGLFRQHALRMGLHGAPPVAGQRAGRAVGFDAAVIAAGAGFAALDQIRMTELHAVVHAAVEHFSIQNDTAAKARAQREEHRRLAADERALVEFSKGRAVRVVRDVDRHAGEARLHDRPKRHVVEAEVVRRDHDLAAFVDAAGHDDADGADLRHALLRQHGAQRCRKLVRHVLCRCLGEGNAAVHHNLQRFVHQAILDVRAADVDADLKHDTVSSFLFILPVREAEQAHKIPI